MKTKTFLLTGVFMFALGGCMSMPISTMYKMSQLSPIDMKPAEVRIAIRTNEAVDVQTGAAKIRIKYETTGDETSSPVLREHKALVEVVTDLKADFSPILLEDIEPRERITILKLSESDAAAIAETLAIAKSNKANGIKGTGNFSISMSSNCFGNLEQFEELEVDLFLQTDAQEGYFLFLEDIDIIEEAKDNNVDLKKTNKCNAE